MQKARKLLSLRWLAGHLLVLTLVVLFVNFGFWQLRRLDQREAYNALLEARLAAEPRPFSDLKDRFSLGAPAEAEDAAAYRRATATGRYDTENEVLLRSRSLNGQPGYHVLTPLVLEEDRALLVDRGWVPFELDSPPIAEAAPPNAPVQVTGILFPSQRQPEGFGAKDPPEGALEAVFWVNTGRLEGQLPYALEPVYLELASQTPPQEGRLPVPPPPPELTRGPHLSYALQWFSFALIGVVGYAFLLRGVLREREEERKEEVENIRAGRA